MGPSQNCTYHVSYLIVMISLSHTGSQDMEETQDEEEVVQEDLIVL